MPFLIKSRYVPQEIDLFNYMSVAENLFMPYEKSGIKGTVNQKELEERAIPYPGEILHPHQAQ